MATSGYIKQATTSLGGVFTVRLEWNTMQVLPETNSTKITWRLTLTSGDSSIALAANRPYTIKINGQTFGGYADCAIGKNQTKELVSGVAIIPHNADGTKSFAYSFQIEISWLPTVNVSASGVDDLNPIITEVTKASIVSAPNFTDEDNPKITYSNPMGEKVTSLQACIAIDTPNGSSVIIAYRDINKTGTSYTFNFTESERTQLLELLENSATYPVRFYVKSVIDGVTYHSFSTPKTLSIANADPIITTAIAEDVNIITTELTGDSSKMIRGANTIQCAMTATAQKNATIVEQSVTCGADTRLSDTPTFTDVEANTFVFKVKDSRGLVATKTVVLSMMEYIKPTCNQTVTMVMESSSTTQAEITVTGNYFNGSFGAANNTLTLEIRHREAGGEWGAWEDNTVMVSNISNGTYTTNVIQVSELDASGTYEFQSRIIDEIMTIESTIGSFTLVPIFDWSKTDFNFNVPVTIQNNPLNDFVIETGTETMGSNGTWYWRKWKSGRAECYGCRNYGNMAVSTAWGSLYKSTIFGQDLPVGLFVETPEAMHIQIRDTGTGSTTLGCWISSYLGWAPDSTTTGGFAVVSPVSGNVSQTYISFNIIGRWK